jgi:cysteinyl-tRNA synthetase
MAKSTGNNILPREILTGENTKAKLSLQARSIFHVTSTTEAFLIFLMMQLPQQKGYKRLMEAMHSLKDISASAKALLIFLLGNNCVMR